MDLRSCVYGDEQWWCICLVLHIAGVHHVVIKQDMSNLAQKLDISHIKYRETFLPGYISFDSLDGMQQRSIQGSRRLEKKRGKCKTIEIRI
jgi:hypothetical protein